MQRLARMLKLCINQVWLNHTPQEANKKGTGQAAQMRLCCSHTAKSDFLTATPKIV